MTYTEHKLTDAMLRRLSKCCHDRPVGGSTMCALEARGLVVHGPDYPIGRLWWVPTDAGREALLRARVEGW